MISWSTPMFCHLARISVHSSGVPTIEVPFSAPTASCSSVGSGISVGHSGTPGGFGNVSRYLKTRLCWRPLRDLVIQSRAASPSSRHMKLVVIATLSLT